MSKSPLSRLFTNTSKAAEALAETATEAITGKAPIERLRQRHAEAVTAVATAQAAYDAANLTAELAPDDAAAGSARDNARTALVGAQERVTALAGAISAAESDEAATAAQNAAAERSRQWDQAEALAKARVALGAKVEDLATKLLAAEDEFREATAAIVAAIPDRYLNSVELGDAKIYQPDLNSAAERAVRRADAARISARHNTDHPLLQTQSLSEQLANGIEGLARLRKARG